MFDRTVSRAGDAGVSTEGGSMPRRKVLILSTSLLVDRVLMYSTLLEDLGADHDVTIWASSVERGEAVSMWEGRKARVEDFPHVEPFKEVPHNYFRRLNEFVWDYRYMLSSRMSMMEHVRDKHFPFRIRALKPLAKTLAFFRAEAAVEHNLEALLLSYPRSPEAEERLGELKPDLIISTGPYQFEQPGVFSAARKLGIPTVAYIPSWDNVTTKNRLVYKYDGYIV